MKTPHEIEIIQQDILEQAKYYWDNPNIPMSINVFNALIRATILKARASREKEIIEIIDEFTRKGYYVHLVDECDCCMKGLSNLLIIKTMIAEKPKEKIK